jgi:hypothetical protein
MEKVATFDGTEALRKDCRFIKGQYYIKDIQCFNINDKWYRINSGYLVFDHKEKKYVLKSTSNLIEGVVNIDKRNIIIGFFSSNITYHKISDTMFYYEGKFYPLLNESLLLNNSHIREGLNGHYYAEGDKTLTPDFTEKVVPNKENFYPVKLDYSSNYLMEETIEIYKENILSSSSISSAYEYLNNYTFGVEFETERGAIPFKYLAPNGLIPCRDGSISGFEYVTVPLSGEKGIQTIKNTCEILNKYCSCSPLESLHIHVGGYPRTMKALASLYRLCRIIQSEIYQLFPYYYTNTSKFKRKGYCNPLPLLEDASSDSSEIFKSLYHHLSGGNSFVQFPSGSHPLDRSGQHKWDVSPRYVWCNMIPLIWNGKSTVEFRCHTPTLNSQKVINWLFIIVAILKYAKKHSNILTKCPVSEIKEITLHTILSDCYPHIITQTLDNYINERKMHYKSKQDCVGEMEVACEMKGEDIITVIPFV